MSEPADAGSLREALRASAPELAPILVETLTSALQSTKRVSVQEPCRKCGCSHIRWVDVPDAHAAASAARTLLEHTAGRPAVAGDGADGGVTVVLRYDGVGEISEAAEQWLRLLDDGNLERLRGELAAALVDKRE